uniref:Olfactory receptor n=1 Tax=Laticauda laticaudata TaxID=8630 RepID=A0A8C5RXV3_LATLA
GPLQLFYSPLFYSILFCSVLFCSILFLTLEKLHNTLLSIPFCFIYTLALLGNATLLWIIWTESSLHQPMYLFLSFLALTNMAMSTCILPKMLGIFWANAQEITFAACLVQMFMVHALSAVESGMLTTMAYDRYVAICNPLNYTTLLTPRMVVKFGAAVVIRAIMIVLPIPLLLLRLRFCHSRNISHTYCEHMALARHKALGTCGAHVGVIFILYTPGLFSFLSHRCGHNIPHTVHIFLANVYLLVPSMLNPMVYGAKTKEIRVRVLRALGLQRRKL